MQKPIFSLLCLVKIGISIQTLEKRCKVLKKLCERCNIKSIRKRYLYCQNDRWNSKARICTLGLEYKLLTWPGVAGYVVIKALQWACHNFNFDPHTCGQSLSVFINKNVLKNQATSILPMDQHLLVYENTPRSRKIFGLEFTLLKLFSK